MSGWVIAILALAGLCALIAVLEHAPAIIRAMTDARLVVRERRRLDEQLERYSLEELTAAVLVAIERTDSDVGPELAERLALTVVEDLNDGVIGPELRTPPA